MARALVKTIAESKNYLMNGAFDFWQRKNTLVAQNEDTSLGYKGPDRWRHRYDDLVASSTVHTWARVADAPVNQPSVGSAFRATYRRGNTGIYNAILQQRIESSVAKELYNENPSGVMSVGCWVKSDTSTSVRITVFVPTAQDNHASQTQIYQTTIAFTANSTWQQIKYENLAVTSAMTNGLAIQFEILSPAAVGADGADKDLRFTMGQLNKGAVVAPFELYGKNLELELMKCQRYFEKSYDISTDVAGITNNGFATMYAKNTQYFSGPIEYSVTKRVATSSVAFYNPSTGAAGQARGLTGGSSIAISAQGPGTHGFGIFVSTGTEDIYGFHWTSDAEL